MGLLCGAIMISIINYTCLRAICIMPSWPCYPTLLTQYRYKSWIRWSQSVARNNGDEEAPVLIHSTASTTPSVSSLRPALSLDKEFFPLPCLCGLWTIGEYYMSSNEWPINHYNFYFPYFWWTFNWNTKCVLFSAAQNISTKQLKKNMVDRLIYHSFVDKYNIFHFLTILFFSSLRW